MAQHFWHRWQTDYLNQLQTRSKWRTISASPNIGDAVLIREENLPPTQWQSGIITALHPGDDGFTRVVTLGVGNGTMKRPITKICPFPKDEGAQNAASNVIRVKQKIKSTRAGKTHFPIFPIITTLLALCATVNYPVNNAITIKQFNISPGLYFDRYADVFVSSANWNVLAYFDLKNFINEYINIENSFNKINNICISKLSENGSCRAISSHLSKKLHSLSQTNSLIFGVRQKRALLNMVGNIASDLFGVLDSRFGEQYVQDMSQLKKNDDHLMQLMKNHTTVVESTLNILKHNDEELAKQAEHLNTICNKIKENRDFFEAFQHWDDAVIYLTHMISTYEQQQNEILKVTAECKKNSISHMLLAPQQIENQMEIIAKHVGNRLIVPRELDIYAIGSVSYYRTNNQYIFKISIPLYRPQKYRLFQIIPVPINRKDEFWWISNTFDYLITTIDRQYYQYVDETIVNVCVRLPGDGQFVCYRPMFWYTANRADCTWYLFNHLQSTDCEFRQTKSFLYWKELRSENRFIFVTNKSVRINSICKDMVSHQVVEGEGIMDLNDDCIIKNVDFQMDSKLTLSNRSNEITLLPNISVVDFGVINLSKMDLTKVNHSRANFSLSEVMIRDIKDNLGFENNVHDIHHYGMIYVIIIAVAIMGIYFMYKLKITKSNMMRTQNATTPIENVSISRTISMPQLG